MDPEVLLVTADQLIQDLLTVHLHEALQVHILVEAAVTAVVLLAVVPQAVAEALAEVEVQATGDNLNDQNKAEI